MPSLGSRTVELKGWAITFGFVAGGLFMIILGVVWEDRRPELRVPEVLIEVGKFVAVVGVVHFLFDLALRKELFREVANATLKYVKVSD